MVPYLSLVIPAYNEARRLPPTLEELGRFCRGVSWPVEILIVVEQSTDGTLQLARECARQQVDFPHRCEVIDNGVQRGKGHAVRSGMRRAQGAIVLYMDADLSVPLKEIPAFVGEFERDPSVDVLVGNRQHAQSHITRSQGWIRRSMGQTFNWILSYLAIANLRDTQCGFKAFRQAACREIFTRQRLDGFAFDVEVLLLAQELGFRVKDLPVEWINSPESKVRIIRDSIKMLLDVIKIRRMLRQTRNTAALRGPHDRSAISE